MAESSSEPPPQPDPTPFVPNNSATVAANIAIASQGQRDAANAAARQPGFACVVVPYDESLLDKAKLLIDTEPTLAVIVAMMACEISATQAFTRAFAFKGLAHLEDPMTAWFSGCSLDNKRIRDLYNAIAGVKIQDQPFWASFHSATELRNSALHGGRVATATDSKSAVDAAWALVRYLKRPT